MLYPASDIDWQFNSYMIVYMLEHNTTFLLTIITGLRNIKRPSRGPPVFQTVTLDMDFSSLSAMLLPKELSTDLQIAMLTMLVLHTELFLIYRIIS